MDLLQLYSSSSSSGSSDESLGFYTTAVMPPSDSSMPNLTAFISAHSSGHIYVPNNSSYEESTMLSGVSMSSSIIMDSSIGTVDELSPGIEPSASSTFNPKALQLILQGQRGSLGSGNLLPESESDMSVESSINMSVETTINMSVEVSLNHDISLRHIRHSSISSSENISALSSENVGIASSENVGMLSSENDNINVSENDITSEIIRERHAEIPNSFSEPHIQYERPLPTPIEDIAEGEIIYPYTFQPTDGGEDITFRWAIDRSQKKTDVLVSSLNHKFTRKSEPAKERRGTSHLCPVYRCVHHRVKSIKCAGEFLPAISLPKGRSRAKAQYKDHTCDPKAKAWEDLNMRYEVKHKALARPECSAMALSEETRRQHINDQDLHIENSGIPQIKQLAKLAQYQRVNDRGVQPKDIHFELDPNRFPAGFFKKNIETADARHLIFGTNQMFTIFGRSRTWYIDATFKVVGPPFYQMTSFHIFVNDRILKVRTQVGCVFVLMSRRRLIDYVKVFTAIVELVTEITGEPPAVECIMMDFESAMWGAMRHLKAREVLSRFLEIKGCNFHFTQAVMRKIRSCNSLHQQYKEMGPSAILLRKFMGLALVPESKVRSCFDKLNETVDEIQDEVLRGNYQDFANYMRTQWIEGNTFKPKDWVVYRFSVRTNNDLEGFHNRLNIRSTSAKLRLDPLVQRMYSEAEHMKTILAEMDAGRFQAKPVNPNSFDRNARLTAIWKNYQEDETLLEHALLHAVATEIRTYTRLNYDVLANPDNPEDNLDDPDQVNTDSD